MAVTQTFTVSEIATAALRKIGVVSQDEEATTYDQNTALLSLNLMLKGWQNRRYLTWTYTSGTLTLTTAASYTLSPVRPVRIVNARFKSGSIETPMFEMTRDEYDSIPQKSSTGQPTQFYYDRQREDALFYVWPVLATAAGETIEYTYEREIEDITSWSQTVDLPVEWMEAAVYNLASRLTEDYPDANPNTAAKVDARAMMLLDDALANDREESVYFAGYE